MASGVRLGETREHEANLEIGYSSWDYDVRPFSDTNLGRFGNGHIVPMLANYRYYPNTTFATLRPFVGVSAGAVRITADIEHRLSGTWSKARLSRTELALGLAVGLSGRFSETVEYEIGYRYLHANGSDVGSTQFAGTQGWVTGPKLDVPATEAHIVSAGLSVRF